MCDYSLQGLPNRLVVEGAEVVTRRLRKLPSARAIAKSRNSE
jgi:hypothetical protein